MLRAQRLRTFLSVDTKKLLHMFCSLKSTLHLSFQLESFNLLLDLQCLDDTFMHPIWNNYNKLLVFLDKLLVKVLSYLHEFELSFFLDPCRWSFKHSLACHECSFAVSLPPWYLTLSTATLHMLKLLRAWRLVDLSIVWALDESLSTLNIKLP